MYASNNSSRDQTAVLPPDGLRGIIRHFISDSILLGCDSDLTDSGSLIDAGIIDSTGAIELVSFLETTFSIEIADAELTPDNLDTIERITALVERKLTQAS